MIVKKCNAVLSLLSFAAMLLHVGYSAYSYLTLYYNPVLTKAFAIPFAVLTCLHAVLGMCSVFFLGDGTRMGAYGKLNRSTVIQRVTAALIFPLLILHIKTFDLLKATSSEGQYVLFALLIIAQIIFYVTVFSHAAVSFSKALITLGLLRSKKAAKTIDIIIGIFCTVMIMITSFAVIKGQVTMFLMG